MSLPQDPIILLSVINTKLRDFYANLDELCKDLNEDKNNLCKTLENIGYKYDSNTNQFI